MKLNEWEVMQTDILLYGKPENSEGIFTYDTSSVLGPGSKMEMQFFKSTGTINYREYRKDRKQHRIDGPSREFFYSCGAKEFESWFLNGIKHRDDGPATRSFYESGKIEKELYIVNGKLHRIGGPADLTFSESGRIIYSEYWF